MERKKNYIYPAFQAKKKKVSDAFSFQDHSFFQVYIYLYDLSYSNGIELLSILSFSSCHDIITKFFADFLIYYSFLFIIKI